MTVLSVGFFLVETCRSAQRAEELGEELCCLLSIPTTGP